MCPTATPLHERLARIGPAIFIALLVAGASWVTGADAQTPPIIDGDLSDLITYAATTGQGCLDSENLPPELRPIAGDICKSNALLIPCKASQIPCRAGSGTYFQNGFDLVRVIAAYNPSTKTLYLGMRAAGAIGDSDGDGTPNAGTLCTPPLNPGESRIQDAPGIGLNEDYVWSIDVNCDGLPDFYAGVTSGSGGIATIAVTGDRTNPAQGAYAGSDLEVSIPNIDMPLVFSVSAASGSNSDGMSEEATGQVKCGQPPADIALSAVATPPEVCAGAPTVLTLTVKNTGQVLLTTNLTNQLPDALAFADGVTGDFSLQSAAVGGLITFNDLEIPPGQTRVVSFSAKASTECAGQVVSQAHVRGVDLEPCSVLANGGQPTTEERDAQVTVTCAQSGCEPSSGCRLTGGGCLNEDGGQRGHKQSTFGGNASPSNDGGGPTGNEWEHVYRDGRTVLFNWHSHDAHVIQCTVVPPGPCHPAAENTKADFVGTGRYSVEGGGRDQAGNMVAYIVDHREGACNKDNRDEYGIIVRTGLVIGEGTVVFETAGEIDCGNLQIHETPARIFGNGTTLTGDEIPATTESVALLNRAYPNPFSGVMTYGYRVEGLSAEVEVGVYNVAGRLVKTLASGSQSKGTYTLTWNGTDEAGMRMAPGIYFLKARVDEAATVSRMIYITR